jgi:hypothetical protein
MDQNRQVTGGRPLAAILAVLGLAACAGQADAPRQGASTYSATRVAMGPCVFANAGGESALAAGIAAAVIPSLVNQGVSLAGTFLAEAGEDKDDASPPAFANMVVANGGMPACIQIVRGSFYDSESDQPGQASPAWLGAMQMDAAALAALRKSARMPLAGQPDFLFEGTLARAAGTNAYTIVPRYVALNRPMVAPALSTESSRGVAVAIDIYGPDIAKASHPVASTALSLGMLRRGEPLCFDPVHGGDARGEAGQCRAAPAGGAAPSGVSGPLVPGAPAARPAPDWREPSRPFETTWFTWAPGASAAPYSVKVVVTESRSGSAFARFLGAVLKGSEAGITTALTSAAEQAVLRQKRDAADIAAATTRRALRTAHLTAVETASQKLQACAAATTLASRATAARQSREAQIEVNERAIGLGPEAFRFATLVAASGDEQMRTSCAAALLALNGS